MDNDVVISVENVTMAFNLNKEKVDNLKEYVIKLLRRQLEFKKFYALQDINFQVRRGQHLGILGLNGAGKSFIRLIFRKNKKNNSPNSCGFLSIRSRRKNNGPRPI